MLDFQGNMVLCANQIWWTAEVEDVFVRISHGQMQAMKNVSHSLPPCPSLLLSFRFSRSLVYFPVFEAVEQSVERGGDVDGRRHVDEQRQEEIRHGVDDRRSHEGHRGRFRQGQHHRSVRVRVGESITVRSTADCSIVPVFCESNR